MESLCAVKCIPNDDENCVLVVGQNQACNNSEVDGWFQRK